MKLASITGWRRATRYYRHAGAGLVARTAGHPIAARSAGVGVLGKSKKDVDLTMPTVSPTVTLPELTTPNVNVPNLSWGRAVFAAQRQ